jgi:hypothetical protein
MFRAIKIVMGIIQFIEWVFITVKSVTISSISVTDEFIV